MSLEIKNNFKRSGLLALEFFLVSYFSEYDLYATLDIKASITSFLISKEVIVYWKILLEKVLISMDYD